MWKNIVERVMPQMTIRRMRIACWVPRATNTHAQCAILSAFPLKQWLQERASMSRYTYIVCLAITETVSVYCAVRTGYLYIAQIMIRLEIQAALACFSCSPPKISFKIFAQTEP